MPNLYLDYLIDPSFQGVNRLFVLSFEDNAHQTSYKQYKRNNCRNKRFQCYGRWTELF